jgi:colanic acid/amylovoran biosynthesis glycosyltransferase
LLYLLYCIPKEKFDIVHCHFGHYGLVGIALKRAGVKSKIVTEFHGQDLSIISKYKKPVRDKLFRECDLFLTVCEYFKKKLIEFGCNSDKIICHHTGIYLNKFNFRTRRLPGKDSIKILTIGRLVEKKGVDYSVRAVAKLLESCEKIEYTIVGAGPLEQQLRTLVSELRIDGKVNFVGTMAHDQLINLYDRSHIFVLSSVTAGDGDHEGIPNALKEAMASGLVVVSTYHSGIDELIVDNVSGLLAPEKNVDALTDKLEYLIEHPEVWAEIGRNARVAVEENFDSEKLSKKLESIYNQLLTSTENAEIR